MTPIAVALCEDHALVREAFRQLIAGLGGFRVAAEFGSMQEVLDVGALNAVDVLVLDLSLPDGNGLDLLDALAARDVRPRVLVLSMHDADAFAHDALRRGASGFLSKRAAPECLPEALRTVAAGGVYHESPTNRSAKRSAAIAHLSPREREVLLQLLAGRTPAEIADLLSVSVKTVYAHRQSMHDKLDVRSNLGLFRVARENGLIS